MTHVPPTRLTMLARSGRPLGVAGLALTAALTVMPVGAAFAVPAAAAPNSASGDVDGVAYELTLLEPVGAGTTSSALGTSGSGQVVGTARTTAASRPQTAITWDDDGSGTDLGALPDATFSRAFDVAADGTAVGEGFTAAPEVSKALLWTPAGELVVLPSLNADGTGVANDVNDAGRVVGAGYNGQLVRAWIGGPDRVRELPLPGAEDEVGITRANAIGDDGTVVGVASVMVAGGDEVRTVQQAVAWADFGATLLTGTVEEAPSLALGVSDDGVTVVGEESNGLAGADQRWQAVAWVDGEAEVLPGLESLRHTRATAVGDDGTAVGYASGFYNNSSFDGRALAWHDGEVTDLNTQVELPEGVVLRSANDVGEDGTIVGSAATPAGGRGFVLTPTEVVAPPVADTHLHLDERVVGRYDQPLTVEVEVHGEGVDAAAMGSVALTIGERELADADLGVDGSAVLTVPSRTLAPGRREATVSYEGDAAHGASQATTSLVVRRARTTTVLSTSTNQRRAVVSVATGDGVVQARGPVVVRLDGSILSRARLQDGSAQLRLPRLERGRHVLVARYLGSDLTGASKVREVLRRR